MPSKKDYPVRYHSDHGDALRQKIFSEMRKRVLSISGSVVENSLKGYIGYGLDLTRNGRLRKTFLQVEVQSEAIKIYLRPIEYQDPNQFVMKAPDKNGWTCDRIVYVRDFKQLDYVANLIQRSYEDVVDNSTDAGSKPVEKSPVLLRTKQVKRKTIGNRKDSYVIDMVSRFAKNLTRRRKQLECFNKYQSQLEGWFKGELICFLDKEKLEGRLINVSREQLVRSNGSRKSVDIMFEKRSGGKTESIWVELKHWHVGYQNQSYYGAPWYFREKHGSGIIGDASKLTEYVEGSKYMLILATKNPGTDEWADGINLFNEKYSPLSVRALTSPTDYPEYFFLGLLQVHKR